MPTALAAYQAHLDLVSEHLWNRRFEELAEVMSYPHELNVNDELITVDSPGTLLDWATKFRDTLEAMGATSYLRVAIAAAFSNDDETQIDGFHRVYALNGATHLIEPYASEARIVLRDGVWLGAGVRATLRSPRYLVDDAGD